MEYDRRTAMGLLGSLLLPIRGVAAAPSTGTRLVLLGTAGGPRIRKKRSNSPQAMVAGRDLMVL
jgi:hypothetical protein